MTRDFSILRRRRAELAVVAAWFVLLNALAAWYLVQTPRMYAASKDVFVATSSKDLSTIVQRGFFSVTRVQSYAALARRPEVLRQVIAEVHADLTVPELASRVTASVPPQTVLLRITVEDTRPSRAGRLAGAIATIVADQGTGLEKTGSDDSSQLTLVPMGGVDVSDRPVSPQPGVTILLTELVALALSLGSLALLAGRRSRLGSAEELHAATGLVTLAGVRRTARSDDSGADRAAEDLRVLRAQLQLTLPSGRVSLVVVPTGPEVSAAAFTLGLARAWAETATSVLLVDGDLGGRTLTDLVGLGAAAGVSDAVASDEDPRPVADPVSPRLQLLAAGTPVPVPLDVLASQRLDGVLTDLRERFEVVLVAAPRGTGSVEAALWARRLEGTVVVASADRTRRAGLEVTARELELAGVVPVGVVQVEG